MGCNDWTAMSVVVGDAAEDFDPGQIGDAEFDITAVQVSVLEDIDVIVAVVLAHRLARNGESVLLAVGDDGGVYIYVGQQQVLGVIDLAEDLADHAGAAADDRGGKSGDGALPGVSGQRVPGNLNGLSDRQTSDLRFVDEGANLQIAKDRLPAIANLRY